GLGLGVEDAGRLDLAVAVFSQRTLNREHALRGRRGFAARLGTGTLRLADARGRARGRLRGPRVRPLDRREQGLVRLGAGLEAGRRLEIADRGIGAPPVATVGHAVVEAAAGEFALDVGDDLAAGARRRIGPGRDCLARARTRAPRRFLLLRHRRRTGDE